MTPPQLSLVFQLLGAAQSVTDRLAAALAELGLSPAGLDLLSRLAAAHEPLPLDDDAREVAVMLERDGLVQSVTHSANYPRVSVALTPLGAARQRAGSQRRKAAYRDLARALGDLDDAALERALSALR